MSFNLMELAKGAISNQVMSSLGGILGEDEKTTSAAVSAGLPALIGGLIGKSSTPSGASDLFGLMEDQDDSVLDNLGSMLGSDNHESFLGGGSGLLGTLLGANQSGLIRMICKMTGLGDGKIATVLSLLAPVVMSLLKRQSKSQGITATGLGGLLGGQKKHIASSLPEGFEDLYDIGGTSSAASRSAAPTKSGDSLFSKLLPLLAILAVGIVAFKFFNQSPDKPADDGNGSVILPGDPALPTDSGLNGSGISIESGPLSTTPTDPSRIQLNPPTESSGVEIEPGPLSPDN